MRLAEYLKNKPAATFTWVEATQGDGIPENLRYQYGIYGVYSGDKLIYIGKSNNLARRLGQFISGFCGGWGHSGANYLFDSRRDPTVGALRRGEIRFEVFTGKDVYERESEAIDALDTQVNSSSRGYEGQAAMPYEEDRMPVFEPGDLGAIFDPSKPESERMNAAENLVNALCDAGGYIRRRFYPWNWKGWPGTGRCARPGLWLYLGWKDEGAGTQAGLWVYEDKSLVFGAKTDEKSVSTPQALQDLLERFWSVWE